MITPNVTALAVVQSMHSSGEGKISTSRRKVGYKEAFTVPKKDKTFCNP